jgi:hypothetical protein
VKGGMYMEQFEDKVTPMQLTSEYKEAVDIFPALHKYKTLHNTDNLKKLCVEIADFCRAVYSSTENEQERKIYFDMLDKLTQR